MVSRLVGGLLVLLDCSDAIFVLTSGPVKTASARFGFNPWSGQTKK